MSASADYNGGISGDAAMGRDGDWAWDLDPKPLPTDPKERLEFLKNLTAIQPRTTTPPVSAPPDRSAEDSNLRRFKEVFLSYMARPATGFPKFAEGRDYLSLLCDFGAWYEQDEGRAFVKGTTRGQMVASVLARCPDAAVSAWIRARSGGDRKGPAPAYFDDGRVDWISVTPRSPDAETIGKARAMEEFLNSPRGRKAMADAAPTAKPTVPFGPELPKTTEFVSAPRPAAVWADETYRAQVARVAAEKKRAEALAAYAAPSEAIADYFRGQNQLSGAIKASMAPFGDGVVQDLLDLQKQGAAIRAKAIDPILIAKDTVAYERLVTQRQADADNHSGKPFTVGPGLAMRPTVRGCSRCRIRTPGRSFCSNCGGRSTSFELRPSESGW